MSRTEQLKTETRRRLAEPAMIDASGPRQRLLPLLLLLLFPDIYPATLHTYTHKSLCPYILICRSGSLVCLARRASVCKRMMRVSGWRVHCKNDMYLPVGRWLVGSLLLLPVVVGACRAGSFPTAAVASFLRSFVRLRSRSPFRDTVAAARPSRPGVLASANFLESFQRRGTLRYLHQTIRTAYGPLKMQSRFAPVFPSFLPQTSLSTLLSLNKSPVTHSSQSSHSQLTSTHPTGIRSKNAAAAVSLRHVAAVFLSV